MAEDVEAWQADGGFEREVADGARVFMGARWGNGNEVRVELLAGRERHPRAVLGASGWFVAGSFTLTDIDGHAKDPLEDKDKLSSRTRKEFALEGLPGKSPLSASKRRFVPAKNGWLLTALGGIVDSVAPAMAKGGSECPNGEVEVVSEDARGRAGVPNLFRTLDIMTGEYGFYPLDNASKSPIRCGRVRV